MVSLMKLPRKLPLRVVPSLIGMLSPLTLVLSLPPVSITWDLIVGKDEDEQARVIFGLAVSAAGLQALATMSLLARYMEHHTVYATWLAIVFNILSAIFMIYPIYQSHQNALQHILPSTESSFVSGIISTTLSLIVALLLFIDRIRSFKKNRNASRISPSQRVLMYLTILTAAWMCIGGLIFSIGESWDFMDAFYFSLVTMATIGFGDLVPLSLAIRIFLIPFASVGIMLLGLLLNAIRIVILERAERAYSERMLRRHHTQSSIQMSDVDPVIAVELDPGQASRIRRDQREVLGQKRKVHLFQELQFATILLVLLWLTGSGIFIYTEDWDFFDSFQFCFVSFTTIGYGDLHVNTFLGKAMFVTFSLFGLVTMAYILSVSTEIFSASLGHRITYIQHEINHIGLPTLSDDSRLSTIVSKVQRLQNLDISSRQVLSELLEASHLYHVQVAKHLVDVDGKLGKSVLTDLTFQQLEADHKAYSDLISLLRDQSEP